MLLGAKQTLIKSSKSLLPIMWFDAIENNGLEHKNLTAYEPWKSKINSNIYDAITFGGNPSWNSNSVSFSAPNQIYYIRQNGNSSGFWQNICNKQFSIHTTAMISSNSYWYGVCGGDGESKNYIGLSIRCASTNINIGSLYGQIVNNENQNITYNCPNSIFTPNTIHCVDCIIDTFNYYVYIDGILQYSTTISSSTPYIFGNDLCFKIGCGWSPFSQIPPSDQYLRGKFYELQIFDFPLT